MRLRTLLALATLLCASGVVFALTGQVDRTQSGGADPQPNAIIKLMCDYLKGLRDFSMETEDSVEEVLDSGQKILYSHRNTATISKPDRLFVEIRGDLKNRTVWKDGTTMTFADHNHQIYAQVEVPEPIDEAMDLLIERYDMSLPLADFFSDDPYSIFTARTKTGLYVGRSDVEGHSCHHLAFSQDNVDWQIWVDAGEVPAPRKIVITYKNEPSRPQYRVILRNIRSLKTGGQQTFAFDTPVFVFEAPDGYEQIEVMVTAQEEGDK